MTTLMILTFIIQIQFITMQQSVLEENLSPMEKVDTM